MVHTIDACIHIFSYKLPHLREPEAVSDLFVSLVNGKVANIIMVIPQNLPPAHFGKYYAVPAFGPAIYQSLTKLVIIEN